MTLALTVPVGALRDLVGLVARVVERRNTIPILSNVVLEAAGDGGLTVTASDLDVWATARLAPGIATVGRAGGVTLPAHLLGDILRKSERGAEIAIEVKSGEPQAILSIGRSRFRLAHLPPEDFPAPSGANQHIRQGAAQPTTAFAISPASLRRIVAGVSFAQSTEETRYYLNGVLLHGHADAPGELTAVATDGHRLATLRLPVDGDLAALPRIIVPRKTVGLLAGLADTAAEGESVQVTASASTIVCETARLRLVSKLVDGTYPDYERVIPAPGPHELVTGADALAEAVDRVSTVSAERGRAVRFQFDDDGTLTLAVLSPEAGEAKEEMSMGSGRFELVIGFNAKYVAEALGTFAGAEISISMQDAGSPALIRTPGDDTRRVVLMPMRV